MQVEEEIARLLAKNHETVTTAESCTGGLIASMIINVPGISGNYNEGYITYSNEAKNRLLGVSAETLQQYGAVSEETAGEMAQGARKAAKADYAVISTGIAGPDGGSPEKPVGLVYLACASKDRLAVSKNIFTGSRQQIRESAARKALELLLGMLQEERR